MHSNDEEQRINGPTLLSGDSSGGEKFLDFASIAWEWAELLASGAAIPMIEYTGLAELIANTIQTIPTTYETNEHGWVERKVRPGMFPAYAIQIFSQAYAEMMTNQFTKDTVSAVVDAKSYIDAARAALHAKSWAELGLHDLETYLRGREAQEAAEKAGGSFPISVFGDGNSSGVELGLPSNTDISSPDSPIEAPGSVDGDGGLDGGESEDSEFEGGSFDS